MGNFRNRKKWHRNNSAYQGRGEQTQRMWAEKHPLRERTPALWVSGSHHTDEEVNKLESLPEKEARREDLQTHLLQEGVSKKAIKRSGKGLQPLERSKASPPSKVTRR